MNVLIIYKLYSRINTEKVAKAMAEAMNATLKKIEDTGPAEGSLRKPIIPSVRH